MDLLDPAAKIANRNLDSVILLHGIMSSGAETDLELGYRVNVDATRDYRTIVERKSRN